MCQSAWGLVPTEHYHHTSFCHLNESEIVWKLLYYDKVWPQSIEAVIKFGVDMWNGAN